MKTYAETEQQTFTVPVQVAAVLRGRFGIRRCIFVMRNGTVNMPITARQARALADAVEAETARVRVRTSTFDGKSYLIALVYDAETGIFLR